MIEGYKYSNEQDALNAQESLKVLHLGNNPTGVTQQWVEVQYNNGALGEFWYIVGDHPSLGESKFFNIDTEEI